MIDTQILLMEAIILGIFMGWVLCFELLFRKYPSRVIPRIKESINKIKEIRNMIPDKIDILLYGGYLVIFAGIWLTGLPLATKVVISGIWTIGLGLYTFISRPEEVVEENGN